MPATDPEYDALYAAVCASPDDDTPRLVLADWLDEHDDPHRAAFIRAQIGLARAREADPHAAAVWRAFDAESKPDWGRFADPVAISPQVALMADQARQAKAHEKNAEARWRAVLGKRSAGALYRWRRGFPYVIAVSNAKRYAQAAAKLPPENLPGYELFVFDASEPGIDDVLACKNFARATGFSLYRVESAEPVRKLGARPEVRNFRGLSLNSNVSDPDVLAAVATQPNWSALASLELSASLYDGARLDLPEEFATAKHLRTLTDLNLDLRGLSGAGLAYLAKLGLPKLRRLEFHLNEVDAVGALALASGRFPELRYLNASSNRIGNNGALILADYHWKLPRLAALLLKGNRISDPKALAALIAGPCFPALAVLHLSGNRCRKLDAKTLAAPGRGPILRLLGLQNCSLSAKAAAALAAAPALAHLVALDLGYNAIGDDGAKAIAAAKWDRLSCLDLHANGITGAGVQALASWPGLARLACLDLRQNPIGLDGAKALVACKALKKCRKLVVPGDTKLLPAAGLKLLREAFGRRLDVR